MADAYVVDTGVFLRWFVDQPGFEHARRVQREFVDGVTGLETIDFARVEVAEVLRKNGLLTVRLNRAEYRSAASAIDDLGVRIHPSDADRLPRAVDLAARLTSRTFDAFRSGCPRPRSPVAHY